MSITRNVTKSHVFITQKTKPYVTNLCRIKTINLLNIISAKVVQYDAACLKRHPRFVSIRCYSHFTQYFWDTIENLTACRCIEQAQAVVLLRQVCYSLSSRVCLGFFVSNNSASLTAVPRLGRKKWQKL